MKKTKKSKRPKLVRITPEIMANWIVEWLQPLMHCNKVKLQDVELGDIVALFIPDEEYQWVFDEQELKVALEKALRLNNPEFKVKLFDLAEGWADDCVYYSMSIKLMA